MLIKSFKKFGNAKPFLQLLKPLLGDSLGGLWLLRKGLVDTLFILINAAPTVDLLKMTSIFFSNAI
jgi:hypothetical protein